MQGRLRWIHRFRDYFEPLTCISSGNSLVAMGSKYGKIYVYGVVHQILSPISNSESTNFLTNIYYDFLFNWQTEKGHLFEPIRSLFSFSTGQWACKSLTGALIQTPVL